MDAHSLHSPTSDSRQRVVLINHLVEPGGRITGITRYAFALIEALARRQAARYVLATCWSREDLPPGIADRIEDIVTLPHVRSTPLSYVNQFRQLGVIARRMRVDCLYSVNTMCPALPGVPSLITVHDLYYDIMPELYARRHRLWWRTYLRFAAQYASAIACVSQNTANDLARHHPHLRSKVGLAPGAGVLPCFAPDGDDAEGAEAPYFLMLGNITPNKNIDFLMDALARLRAAGAPVRIVHVGRDLSGDLARAVERAGPGLIETRGGLDDRALDKLMRGAIALVQPSLYEGFGLPIIEAHDRGVPVIASDIAVFREVAGHGAAFAPLGDADALAMLLRRFADDAGYRNAMASAAAANSARFSWDRSAACAEALIAGALAPQQGQRRGPRDYRSQSAT